MQTNSQSSGQTAAAPQTPAASQTPAGTQSLLTGITVADFSRVLAGPYATRMLADQGATVYKIEIPGAGDDSRHLGPFDDQHRSTYFSGLNHGKQSIEVDLKDPADHTRLMEFLGTVDVVVENFRPGVAAKLGIDFDSVKTVNPDIVYASISGFGQTGSNTRKPAYDTVIQALTGIMATTGTADGGPTRIGESMADVAAGVWAGFGIATALFNRERMGAAAHIDVPMYDVLVAMQPTNAAMFAATGTAPTRVGNRHPVSAPFDTYQAADGLFVIAVANDRLFATLATALDHPEWAQDPRFLTDALRSENAEELKAAIQAQTAHLTVAQACTLLDTHGVPASPVQDYAQALTGAIGTERGLALTDPRTGHRFAAHPLLVDGTRPGAAAPVPTLGEHNASFPTTSFPTNAKENA